MMKITIDMIHRDLRKYASTVLNNQPSLNSITAIRKRDRNLKRKFYGKWFGRNTHMEEKEILRNDRSSLRICIVYPNRLSGEESAGLLWLHGGGYGTALPEECYPYAERFLVNGNVVMVLPDYRKSYEAPYPAALEDAYLTLKWMKKHACELHINPHQLFVGGESAGGGLVAALSAYARDMNEVKIAFQMPLYPMIDDRPSSENKQETLAWTTSQKYFHWQLYKRNLQDVPVYCAPARLKDFRNLPPTFTVVGTLRPFHEETVTYMKHLYKAGVTIMLKEYEGCFHMFDTRFPNAQISKEVIRLEQKVFQYAQQNFFARQDEISQEDESFQEDIFRNFHAYMDTENKY